MLYAVQARKSKQSVRCLATCELQKFAHPMLKVPILYTKMYVYLHDKVPVFTYAYIYIIEMYIHIYMDGRTVQICSELHGPDLCRSAHVLARACGCPNNILASAHTRDTATYIPKYIYIYIMRLCDSVACIATCCFLFGRGAVCYGSRASTKFARKVHCGIACDMT